MIPGGCANAFLTLSNDTVIHYYMNQFFEDQDKRTYKGFRYNDKFFNIKWPIKPLIISKKDKLYKNFDLANL